MGMVLAAGDFLVVKEAAAIVNLLLQSSTGIFRKLKLEFFFSLVIPTFCELIPYNIIVCAFINKGKFRSLQQSP